jgi:hypothetical protein
LLKGTQSDMALPGKAQKLAVYAGFGPPKLPYIFRTNFWGRTSGGILTTVPWEAHHPGSDGRNPIKTFPADS